MSTTYSCGRCGAAVSKSAKTCPHCSARLAGIRCTQCKFVGSEDDFPGDLCPECGAKVSISKSGTIFTPTLAGWALIVFGIFWGVATIGAFFNEPPEARIKVPAAAVSFLLFVCPALLGGWYFLRNAKQ